MNVKKRPDIEKVGFLMKHMHRLPLYWDASFPLFILILTSKMNYVAFRCSQVLKLVQEWQEALQSDGHRKKKEKKYVFCRVFFVAFHIVAVAFFNQPGVGKIVTLVCGSSRC